MINWLLYIYTHESIEILLIQVYITYRDGLHTKWSEISVSDKTRAGGDVPPWFNSAWGPWVIPTAVVWHRGVISSSCSYRAIRECNRIESRPRSSIGISIHDKAAHVTRFNQLKQGPSLGNPYDIISTQGVPWDFPETVIGPLGEYCLGTGTLMGFLKIFWGNAVLAQGHWWGFQK